MFRTIDVGAGATGDWDVRGVRGVLREVGPSLVVVAVSNQDSDDGLNHSDLVDEVASHCYLASANYLILDVGDTSRWSQYSIPLEPTYTHGDLSYYASSQDLLQGLEGWSLGGYPLEPACDFGDVFTPSF